MRFHGKLAIASAGLALIAAPAFALPGEAPDNQGTQNAPATTPAGPPSSTPPENQGTANRPDDPGSPDNQGTAHKPDTPGPNASLPAKAKAYGKYCQGQSKKRSDAKPGTKGTPFSQCVTAMAKLATGNAKSPRTACKEQSRKHVAGQRGTPFSRCVSAGAKLLNDQT